MIRIIFSILCFFTSYLALAASSYQVDVILFAHPYADLANQNSPFIPVRQDAISLKLDSAQSGSYCLLKPSQSNLKDEYYSLNRRSKYQVLAQYSWRQPSSNQSAVILPAFTNKGWTMQGTMRVKQSTYYVLNTELQFAPGNNPDASFTLRQNQRLKPNTVYYLDHPQIGMIIKIVPMKANT